MGKDAAEGFAPARNKLEAVKRIGRLTNTHQDLGPGSKERKGALLAVSATLGLVVEGSLNKPSLGAEIARLLGIRWGADCYSAGQTITLVGLNRLLEPLEAQAAGAPVPDVAPEHEAAAIVGAAAPVLGKRWRGRAAVQQMRRAGSTQWAQDEWAGFYFEFLVIPALVERLGGGPVKIHNTRFDYHRRYVWDLKWHSGAGRGAPLNDGRAIEEAVASGGVGFIVLTGEVEYDNGEFREWQRQDRLSHGRVPSSRSRPPAYVRRSKTGFEPQRLEVFFVSGKTALEAALATRAMTGMLQGRQAGGAVRNSKYALDLPRARDSLLVASLLL